MSEDGKAQGPGLAFADIAAGVVEDCLYNIIHDIVLQTHREEKLLRMQSAATVAEQAAIAEHQENAEKVAKGSNPQPPSVKIDTPAAAYDNGRVTLRGNPLKTTPEITCAHCKLPRLLYPIAGAGSQLPDLSRQYCTKHPFVSRPGHDIYNNPFPTDMAKTKKERELIKRQEKDNTPGSQQDADNGNSQENSLSKLAPGGKPASYIPWHTCPNCKRSLLITRFAQHAEKCLGISGRQSSRNAMAKLNSQGSGSAVTGNTPLGSRMGTPVPGSQGSKVSPLKKSTGAVGDDGGGDGGDDDGGGGDTPKKVKKKSSYVKKADRERDRDRGDGEGGEKREKSGSKILKLKTSSNSLGSSSKRPPKDGDAKEGTPGGGSSKREREKDGDGEEAAAPKKKIKLFKSDSVASDMTATIREKEKEKDGKEKEREKEKEKEKDAVGSPASTAS